MQDVNIFIANNIYDLQDVSVNCVLMLTVIKT